MHYALLDFGFGKAGANGFGKAPKVVHRGDKNILHSAVSKPFSTVSQNLADLCSPIQTPSTSLRPSRTTTMAM